MVIRRSVRPLASAASPDRSLRASGLTVSPAILGRAILPPHVYLGLCGTVPCKPCMPSVPQTRARIMTTRRLAEQCGLFEAALGIVADGAGAALTLPAGELARELAAIRDYAAGA